MGEYQAELASQENLLETGVLRLHNVYGPPCELSPEKSQVIPALIRKAIRCPDEEFVVWGSGNQRRAFLFVEDAVDGLLRLAERGMDQGVIQIGPDASISIREIAERVVDISGKSIDIHYDTDRPEGDMDRAADWSRAKNILNWKPRIAIDQGLNKTYNWCQEWLDEHELIS